MTNGKTFTVTEQLNSEEDFDALQEVTADLEQAEARIEELEAENETLRKGFEIYEREHNRYKHATPEIWWTWT